MFRLALRNTMRNKRRTILTAFAVFIAIFVVLVVLAWLLPVVDDMRVNNIRHMYGNIRIRKADYTKYEDVMPLQFFIEDAEVLAGKIEEMQDVTHVECISTIYASAYIDGEMKSTMVYGIDPTVSNFTQRDDITVTGSIMGKDEREVMTSTKFLYDYNLKIGDNITIITRTAQGGTNGASFKIVGTIEANDAALNVDIIYMPLDRLSKVAHMDGGALELRVEIVDDNEQESLINSLKSMLGEDYEVVSWHEISVLYSMINIYNGMVFLIAILFFIIASTLIVNTTMMSVMERKKELSTMASLGFSRWKIRLLFIEEGTLISMFGGVASMIVSFIVISILNKTGIDLAKFGVDEVEGWGFSRYSYPFIEGYWYFITTAGMIAVSFIATIIATRHIKRIEIADALREDN